MQLTITAAVAGHGVDTLVTLVVLAVAAVALAGFAWRRFLAGRGAAAAPHEGPPGMADAAPPRRRPIAALALTALGALLVAALALDSLIGSSRTSQPLPRTQAQALATNPYLDPGFTLSRRAPAFTLTDQFGRRVSLRQFRGKVVLLAFNDSECTTICPLTTASMLDAKAMLGRAGRSVELLGIDANPDAIALRDVWSYSEDHGMLHAWRFLTGSLPQLRRVWHDYGVEAQVVHGQIDHTPALFLIGPDGIERKVYLTQMSYTAIGQLGQLLAQGASDLLPGHPPVHSHLSYARQPVTPPTQDVSLPGATGGSLPLGPRHGPRLLLFFASWDSQVTDLSRQLVALNRYAAAARAPGSDLPPPTAVDEASVEPSSKAVTHFLATLPGRLSYPVAVDRSGRVADGYEVQDEPWYVLVSGDGRLLWYRDVSTAGWPSTEALKRQVRAAMARAPHTNLSAAAVARQLAGSPAPLAALHSEANRVLGGLPALQARIRALRGYPVVVNAWGSWCDPCRAEAGLLASAAARYGRRVAFLGADVNDDASSALSFLAQHPVSYPSYGVSSDQLGSIFPGGLANTPTTIFIGPAGKVRYVHEGEYLTQGSLDDDIQSRLLNGS